MRRVSEVAMCKHCMGFQVLQVVVFSWAVRNGIAFRSPYSKCPGQKGRRGEWRFDQSSWAIPSGGGDRGRSYIGSPSCGLENVYSWYGGVDISACKLGAISELDVQVTFAQKLDS